MKSNAARHGRRACIPVILFFACGIGTNACGPGIARLPDDGSDTEHDAASDPAVDETPEVPEEGIDTEVLEDIEDDTADLEDMGADTADLPDFEADGGDLADIEADTADLPDAEAEDGEFDESEEDGERDVEEDSGCPDGFIRCDEECVDPWSDDDHCRTCDISCDDGEICLAATCRCPPGLAECDDRCVDLSSDRMYCETCDDSCEGGEVCSMGSCLSECDGDFTECGEGDCADLDTSHEYCGSCENSCGGHELCILGSCAHYTAAGESCDSCPCEKCDSLEYTCCSVEGVDVPLCIDSVICP
ncbi:MAG: hypothetical protein ABIJ56_02865 [Pseudomonadota bacterium]